MNHPGSNLLVGPTTLEEAVIPGENTTTVTDNKRTTYRLRHGDDDVRMTGRQQTIRRAKDLSMEGHGPVHVERADERVEMIFRNGDLVKYRFESHRRS